MSRAVLQRFLHRAANLVRCRPSQYDPDGPPAPQFRIVHAVRISNDGLVYVYDRTNNRIQVFRKDGAFIRGPLSRLRVRPVT